MTRLINPSQARPASNRPRLVAIALMSCLFAATLPFGSAAAPASTLPVSSLEDCYAFHNIPFTDLNWPDRYLPDHYHSGDASTVWGFPVNFEFSAAGVSLLGCLGDPNDASDDWWLGVTMVLVQPPNVPGVTPVYPTTDASPVLATDGGFNFYALEYYAEGDVLRTLQKQGVNVQEKSLSLTLPDRIELGDDFYYHDTSVAYFTLHNPDGSVFGSQYLAADTVWNHRNFEFQYYSETSKGTSVSHFSVDDSHLLVGPARCDYEDGSLPEELFASMPYLHGLRQRSYGDCPDDGLGALWMGVDFTDADTSFLKHTFAQ